MYHKLSTPPDWPILAIFKLYFVYFHVDVYTLLFHYDYMISLYIIAPVESLSVSFCYYFPPPLTVNQYPEASSMREICV